MNSLTVSILKGITKINPSDYPTLEDFCMSMVYSVQKTFEIEFPDIIEADLFELDDLHMEILNALKNNQHLELLGTGTFSSVFCIPNTNKAFKINVASCDSFSDSWLQFAEKLVVFKSNNPWLPKIHYLFKHKYIYGCIVDNLKPISICNLDFQKKIVNSIRNTIKSFEDANFKVFKSETRFIEIIMESYNKSESSKDILEAIEFIISVKKKTKSELDIFPQNIMIDQDNNIIINDPLSYDKTCIK